MEEREGVGCTCLTVFKSAVSAGGISSGCCLPTADFFTFFPLLPAAGGTGRLSAMSGATLHGDKSLGFLNPADCASRPRCTALALEDSDCISRSVLCCSNSTCLLRSHVTS
jgi:hypothetical protein